MTAIIPREPAELFKRLGVFDAVPNAMGRVAGATELMRKSFDGSVAPVAPTPFEVLCGLGCSRVLKYPAPEHAVDTAPVVYVHTPAHPVSARAGDHPWMIRAVAARSGTLVLAPEDADRLREAEGLSDLLRSGGLVVIVD